MTSQEDPLASGTGGAWGGVGAGAGGFGKPTPGRGAESYAVTDGEEFDVVDIVEPDAPAAASKKSSNGRAGGTPSGGQGLAAREAALKKREADIARREAAAATPGGALMVKNWPPCWPIVHHDISADIPEGKRGITRAGFFIFLLTVTALTYNLVAVVIACLAADVTNIASAVVFSIIYFIVGIPGAWVTWYGRLYRAMIFDGAVSFATFFFFFMIHIAFAIWSAISPSLGQLKSGSAHAGFFPALEFIKKSSAGNRIAGIMYFFGAALWSSLAFISFLYLFRVYKFFRTSGGEDRAAAQVRSEVVRQGVQMSRA